MLNLRSIGGGSRRSQATSPLTHQLSQFSLYSIRATDFIGNIGEDLIEGHSERPLSKEESRLMGAATGSIVEDVVVEEPSY